MIEVAACKIVPARSPWHCGECRGVIHAGDHYQQVSLRKDGLYETFRMCVRCLQARRAATKGLPTSQHPMYGRMLQEKRSG